MEYAEKLSATSQKLVLRLGLRPAPLTPDLASQTMPAARSITPACTSGRRARLAGGGDECAAELGETVDRFGQQIRLRVGLLIPGRVVFGRAQAEGAAEIHN